METLGFGLIKTRARLRGAELASNNGDFGDALAGYSMTLSASRIWADLAIVAEQLAYDPAVIEAYGRLASKLGAIEEEAEAALKDLS